MGGKTSKSTQQITIPPEVLARYNAINARADTVTNKPYQYYQGQFVAPLTATQQAGISNTNAAAGMAQPYFGAATGQLMGAQQAAMPYYQGATQQLAQGINTGNQLAAQSYNTLGTAQEQAAGIQGTALNNFNAAYAGAQPYNQAAGSLYQEGLEQGRGLAGQSSLGTQQALAGAQPFQQAATQYMGSGAQAVNPTELGADQINKYMSPYLSTVLQGTAGLLNQQNQQQQAGQMGNAIRSGAFGGDRSGIAAANLSQQQNLANSKIFSDLLNQGFGQALGTAQQQQQLGLGAAQANRAAQQQAAQQALAIGQQGFGQGLSAAQQQAALGQQLFGMGSTTGQNAAALGQQVYGQGTGTAAQQAALGQQIFGQGATAAAQQAALGQQQFGQGATAAQQAAALGQGLYGMGSATSQQLAALGTGAQGAALSGAGAQLAAGQAEQATQQAENTAKYNEFLQAQSLPYQQLKLASDIALGTGTASGSTTTTAQPGGFFSDERLKENIKAVGKTFDGQTIHSYNYKGDPRTQIGLIAQEVQKHHPEAVGLAGGYKTVDYDKATEDASDRGHMAHGGLASAGGSVMPQDAGQGFADGGLAGYDPAVMQQMLAAQQAMYAPLSSGQMYAGGPNAGGGLVPQSGASSYQLMTPSALAQQATGAEKAKAIVDLGNSVNKFGEGIGAWGGEDNASSGKGFRLSKDTLKDIRSSAENEKNQNKYSPYDIEERVAAANGGGMPYGGQGLDIPTSGLAAGSNGPMTANALQSQQSGLDKLSKVANVADTGMKLGKFGKKIGLFSTGGSTPYGGQGLDIPEGDTSSEKRQVMTAPALEKPESDADKAMKIAQIAAMFASDKRMKENIKPIGKLFDGQIVHSYNYKGDPRTQIGLIAQEVEHHKPHAVGLAGKYKAVDYAKATSGAAKRGHFAEGGMPEESYDSQDDYPVEDKFFGNLLKSASSGKNIHPISGEELPMQVGEGASQEATGLAGGFQAGLPKVIASAKANELSKPAGLAPTVGALPKGIMQIARLIHAGEGTGKNPRSSALGPYQFVDDTFVGQFQKNYPDRAKGMSKQDIIALKRSPEGRAISEAMGPKLIANNAKIVERAGFEPDAGNVYLAHFLGPDTAVKVLRAHPNAPISRYVSQEAIDANPPLQKNPTVGGAINWARGYMAQQEKNLSRKGLASGGLAGRDGYALDGRVEDNFRIPEDIDALSEMERLPAKEIIPAPEMRKTDGLAPPPAAMPTKAPATLAGAPAVAENSVGLGAGSPASMAREVAEDVPEERAGLAKRVFGYDKSRPYDPKTNNKFLQRLGHGETDAVLTALQGLAAMGTAPTRSLGVALASGLGAGAQAYQAQREFARQKQETGIRGFGAETARMQIPISQQIANTQTISGLRVLRDKAQQNLIMMKATGADANNPLYRQAQAEFEAISRKIYEKEKIEGLEPAKAGTGDFFGAIDFSKPADMQKLGFGLALAGAPGAEVPTNIATTARDTGRILTEKGVEPVAGFAGTTADIEAVKTGAIGATENNRIVYDNAMKNWQDVKLNVEPVLSQLPEKLPETGLTAPQISGLASAVRVLASTQGYDASGINGDDPRSVITAAGQMLGIPINANDPTSSVAAVVRAMKTKVWQMSNAARAASSWASDNSDPRTGRPDYSRGNVQDVINKAMAQ